MTQAARQREAVAHLRHERLEQGLHELRRVGDRPLALRWRHDLGDVLVEFVDGGEHVIRRVVLRSPSDALGPCAGIGRRAEVEVAQHLLGFGQHTLGLARRLLRGERAHVDQERQQQRPAGQQHRADRHQRNRAARLNELALDARNGAQRGGGAVVGEGEQQLVAGPQAGGVAGHVQHIEGEHVVEGDVLRLAQAHLKVVPLRAGDQVFAGLEGLRLLVGVGHALRGRAGADGEGGLLLAVERVGQIGRCGHAGPKLIAHEPRQLRHRAALGGGAQVVLVRDALLVEAEHVAHRGPGVEQCDGRVAAVARGQALQRAKRGVRLTVAAHAVDLHRRKPGLHAREELAVRPHAIAQRRQPGPVELIGRGELLHAFAAAAGLMRTAAGRCAHESSPVLLVRVMGCSFNAYRPPLTAICNCPRSGWFGSLSSWAISLAASGSTPLSIS